MDGGVTGPIGSVSWPRIMGSANRRGRKLDKETLPKFPISREVA